MSDNLRNVTVDLFNQTSDQTMTVTNAFAVQGSIVTKDFPLNVENNGGNALVDAQASSARQGSIGQVNYVVQDINNCSVNFTNTMSTRSVDFQIGNGGPKVPLRDTGETVVYYGGMTWNFSASINNLDYVIKVAVSN